MFAMLLCQMQTKTKQLTRKDGLIRTAVYVNRNESAPVSDWPSRVVGTDAILPW